MENTEDRKLIEEMCNIIAEKAVPHTESYRQKARLAAEAREALEDSLSCRQKELFEKWIGVKAECAGEEELYKFCLIFRLAYEILKS